ncbi:hypothetical protein [Novosphingobium sp.]|uniref:hypothetical protein n=1 Tax=Novosphingobium sp. TaxID=1874826 RepID=UPI00286D7E3C|nr:hypothetical protein [Novosphingobium sp.]
MNDPSNPIADALADPRPAPELAIAGDRAPELDRMDEYPEFPPACPIKVLGNAQDITGKQTIFYLNYNGQLVGLEAGNRHGKLGLAALFGPSIGWIEANYPKWSEPKKQYDPQAKKYVEIAPARIIGFDQAKAAEALVVEGTRRGIFDPAGRMRGRGAHRLNDGGLALHCGDAVLVSVHRADNSIKGWNWVDTGLHAGMVYPAAAGIPRPHLEAVDTKPAETLLRLLRSWQWKRPLLDARFALAFAAIAPLGGALAWRPNLWITGGKGTGKSTLNGLDGVYHRLYGEGLFRTGNASAAAIRQSLKNSTVPVIFDEIEAGEDNRQVNAVIELARVSSSGDAVHRGGQDHTAHEFTLRSAFMFSSISIPPLQPQDRSRLAILELGKLAKDGDKLDLDKWHLPKLGRQLSRRMIDQWHRLAATKAKFHDALQLAGHDARACDQFGILLAAADLALNDWDTVDGLPDDEEVALWAGHCRPDRMAEISEAVADEEACLNHMKTTLVQARGGDEREPLGQWIGQVVAGITHPLLENNDALGDKASKRLRALGLSIVTPTRKDSGAWGAVMYEDHALPAFLGVANNHQALSDLFGGTKWQGGVWRQSLARCDGSIDAQPIKFGRISVRAVLIPLHLVLDETELPAASQPGAVKDWRDGQEKGAGA